MHKSQVLFCLLAAFLAGVFVASFLSFSQSVILALLIVGVIIAAVSVYHRTFKQTEKGIYRRKLGVLIGAIVLVFSFGIWRFNNFNLSHKFLDEFADRKVSVILRGYVDGEESISVSTGRFVLRVKQIILPKYGIKTDEKILITTKFLPEFKYGDLLTMNGEPEMPKNFEGFDYVTYLKKEGVKVVMAFPEIKNDDKLKLGLMDNLKVVVYRRIFYVKDRFETAVNKSVVEPNASFINGILLGSRQNIPDDLKNDFNRTSTSHILAISGYNITIISEVILAALVIFFRRRLAFWFSVIIIILFVIMTGASASVVRAAIMGLLLLFASGYGRLYDVKNSIVLAGALMVLINPFVLVFDVGFQLSFGAVLGLIYLYPILKNKFNKISEQSWSGIKDTALMTASAQIFVFPLLIYYFQNFSLVSLPANILVLPFVPLAMMLGFLTGIAAMIFLPLGKLIGFFAWAITAYQIKVIEFLGSLPFASLAISISVAMLVVIYLLLITIVLKINKRAVEDERKL